MMKKLFLLIGLLTVFIFLVSCTDNIAGEAFKFKAPQPKCVKEICDNKDNDCNGIVDNDVKNCCKGVSTTLDTTANCGSCGNVCKAGQNCLNGVCAARTYSCTGSVPANAQLCINDDKGLTMDTPRTTVSGCTVRTRCEYTCNVGFTLQNGACVAVTLPPCTDSDNGTNYTVRGTAQGPEWAGVPQRVISGEDHCITLEEEPTKVGRLMEYVCRMDDDGTEKLTSISANCSEVLPGSVCQDGACVAQNCIAGNGYRGNNPNWPCCAGRELKPGNPSGSITSCCLPQDCGYDNVCFANRYNASWGNCNNGVWSVPVAAPTNFCYYVASNGTQMPAGTGNYVFYNYSAASYQYRGVVTESGPLQNVCSPTNSGNTVRQICTNNTRGFDGYSSGLNWSVTTTESLCRVGGCNPSTGNCCVERSVESSCQGNTLTNSTYTDCSAEPITRVIDCSTTLSFLNRAGVCETRGTRTGCFTPRCTPGETANTCGSNGNYVYTCAADGLRWSYTGGGSGCTAGQSCQNGACVAPTTFSCTGTVPANSTLCTGDDASLSANTVRTTVAACTAGTKCEYACNTGYTLQNGVCVNASPFYCDGNTAINASGTYNCETRYSIASGQPLICREVIMNGLTTGRCGENCTAGSRSILCSYYSGTYHYTNYLCSSYRIWNQENSVSSCSTGQTCTANSTRNGICS